MKKYLAEFLGTFTLSLLVALSIIHSIPVATPVLAGLVLMLFVYSIGHISGCHINPAVTIGLFSIKKISKKEATNYLAAQFAGGIAALFISGLIAGSPISLGNMANSSLVVFFGELMGMLLFAFGIASVVYGKVESSVSGIVVGGSLLAGILCAVMVGSNGVLNPAVAIGIQSFNFIYLLAPIIGSVLGMKAYEYLHTK
jgi:aquaporin Z